MALKEVHLWFVADAIAVERVFDVIRIIWLEQWTTDSLLIFSNKYKQK